MRKGKLADFKYWKGCKTEKGPAPSRRLLRTDPGPARGKGGRTAPPKTRVALRRDRAPRRWRLFGESQHRRGLLPSLPPKAGTPPRISSQMASDLCLEGTRGSFQLRLPRHEPRRAGTIHQPLSKGEQKSKPSASECPRAPGLAEPSRKSLLPRVPGQWRFPGAASGRLQNKEEATNSWQAVSKGE